MDIGEEQIHGREIVFERENFLRGLFSLLKTVQAKERFAEKEVANPGCGFDLQAVTCNFLRVAVLLLFIEKLAEREVGVGKILTAQFDRSTDGLLRFLRLTEAVVGEPDFQVGLVVGWKD